MNQELIEKNKQKLEAEKKRLEKMLSRISRRDAVKSSEDSEATYPNISDDMDDNAIEVEMYEANIGEEKTLDFKLGRVNDALARIAKGTYGTCVVGGEPIEEARILAVPEAATCVRHSK